MLNPASSTLAELPMVNFSTEAPVSRIGKGEFPVPTTTIFTDVGTSPSTQFDAVFQEVEPVPPFQLTTKRRMPVEAV